MTNENPFPLFRNLVLFTLREARKQVGLEWKPVMNAALSDEGARLSVRRAP
jgi:hypothetical protein